MKKELEYSKMLETAGLSREQAEVHLKVIEGAMQDNIATKLDLYEAKSQLSGEIKQLSREVQEFKSQLSGEMQEFKSQLSGEMQEFKSQLSGEMQEFKSQLGGEMQEFKSQMSGKLSIVRTDIASLKNEFNLLEYRLVHKMGLMITAATTVLSGVAALLKFAF